MKGIQKNSLEGHRGKALRRMLALMLCAMALLSGCARRTPQTDMANFNAQVAQIEESMAPAPPDNSDAMIVAANPMDETDSLNDAGSAGNAEDGYDVTQDAFDSDTASFQERSIGELNVGLVLGEQAALNPLKCTYRDLISMNELVFESLIALDDSMQPVGELSDSWTMDGNTIVFHLRNGVQFHNGEPLNALDVVESWQYIVNQGDASPWYDRVKAIDSMVATDVSTLSVKFTNAGFVSLYAMTFPIVQRYTLSYALPMGTGPYWYRSYVVGSYLRLESNPLWWKKEARLHSIVGWRYAETADALQALLTGEIDTLATRSVHASLYRKLSDFTTMDYSTNIYEFLVPNLTGGAMKDVKMREALMYAIDRTAIASTVYGNMVQESEVPVVPGSYLYETQAARYNYSPERALQLLHELGLKDTNADGMLDEEVDGLLENFTLHLVTYNEPGSESRTEAARLIADQLKKVGVTVEIETVAQDKMARIFKNGSFDLALIAINLPFTPDLTALLRHDGKLNYSGYASREMNNLLLGARSASTVTDLTSIYSRIQMLVVEQLPILGMYFHTGSVISTTNVRALHGIYDMNTWNGMELVEPQA